ncbi:MAG: hypothetical protein QOE20_4166 [Mycobacterium sp.]|jgi:hypothetical protein|nr:hypothetical protein [Mycobacterium sp.]
MTIFDRFAIRVIAAGAGLCGAAMAFSPDVAAAPLTTGGYECMQPAAGQAGAAPVAAPVAAGCSSASAAVADMAGIPMALPGPVPMAPPVPVVPPLPLAPPIPAVPVIPAGAPAAAGVPAGVIDMAKGYAGKGDLVGPPAPGAPVSGQPILPGPGAGGAN